MIVLSLLHMISVWWIPHDKTHGSRCMHAYTPMPEEQIVITVNMSTNKSEYAKLKICERVAADSGGQVALYKGGVVCMS